MYKEVRNTYTKLYHSEHEAIHKASSDIQKTMYTVITWYTHLWSYTSNKLYANYIITWIHIQQLNSVSTVGTKAIQNKTQFMTQVIKVINCYKTVIRSYEQTRWWTIDNTKLYKVKHSYIHKTITLQNNFKK